MVNLIGLDRNETRTMKHQVLGHLTPKFKSFTWILKTPPFWRWLERRYIVNWGMEGFFEEQGFSFQTFLKMIPRTVLRMIKISEWMHQELVDRPRALRSSRFLLDWDKLVLGALCTWLFPKEHSKDFLKFSGDNF